MAVRNLFERIRFWKRTVADSEPVNLESSELILASRLRRYEKYVAYLQSIIMWDSPIASVVCVLSVNVLFWIFVSMEWKCYGIISTVLLALSVHDAWTGHIWPEISVTGPQPPPNTPPHPSVVSVSRLLSEGCARSRQCLAWLRNLRLQQPGVFCCLSSLVCSGLLLVGRSVSGLLVVYSLLMAVLLLPGLYIHGLSPQLKATLAQHIACIRQSFALYSSGDTSDDEYLPVTTSEDLALLTRASDIHHGTYDSITSPESLSEAMPGLMPSHEEDSLGTLSDLEPRDTLMPLDLDDSDSNHGDQDHQIEFQSGHFNGDSSSEDSDPFSRDLVFSDDRDEQDAAVTRALSSYITQAVASNLMGSVGLLASVMSHRQTTAADTTRRASSSDSDEFEIIDRDELN